MVVLDLLVVPVVGVMAVGWVLGSEGVCEWEVS